jgi:hypothetical protein
MTLAPVDQTLNEALAVAVAADARSTHGCSKCRVLRNEVVDAVHSCRLGEAQILSRRLFWSADIAGRRRRSGDARLRPRHPPCRDSMT